MFLVSEDIICYVSKDVLFGMVLIASSNSCDPFVGHESCVKVLDNVAPQGQNIWLATETSNSFRGAMIHHAP